MNEINILNAFQRVAENEGCAGADGVTIAEFEADLDGNCADLAREINSRSYLPLPLLKILVDIGGGHTRALCIPAVRDRVVQTAVLHEIEPILEHEFEACSFGYRRGRSVRQAVDLIQSYYDQGYRWVVDCDVDTFFDRVDHDVLLTKARRLLLDPDILRLIRLWITGEIWDGDSISVMSRGIPQGSPISPILANLFLDELDEELLGGGYKIVRYADDFVVLCRTPEKAQKALALTEEVLRRLSLELDEAEIVDFDRGFVFLGVLFLKSMALKSISKKKTLDGIVRFPGYLNMEEYFRLKKKAEEDRK